MAKQPIDLGIISFHSKSDATAYFRSMLRSYEPYAEVTGSDRNELEALLARHPEAAQKNGAGIAKLFVAPSGYGTPCFWLRREDGSETEFSFMTCIAGKSPSIEQQFAQAARVAVRSDLRAAKQRFFNEYADEEGRVNCPSSGKLITIEEAHIDHKAPMTFEVILKTFLKANPDVVPSHLIISPPADKQPVPFFTDKDVERRFREYHHSIAADGNLEIVSKGENLKAGPKHRVRAAKKSVSLK